MFRCCWPHSATIYGIMGNWGRTFEVASPPIFCYHVHFWNNKILLKRMHLGWLVRDSNRNSTKEQDGWKGQTMAMCLSFFSMLFICIVSSQASVLRKCPLAAFSKLNLPILFNIHNIIFVGAPLTIFHDTQTNFQSCTWCKLLHMQSSIAI